MQRHEKALEILHNGTVIPAIPLVLDENRQFDEKYNTFADIKNDKIDLTFSTNNIQNIIHFSNIVVMYTCY